MTGQECRQTIYRLTYVSSLNQRYHAKLRRFWAIADRAIRIIVGMLAVAAAIFAVPPLETPWPSLWVAIAAAVAAFVLNVVPVGDWEKIHAELFRLWSDVRKDAEQTDLRARGLPPDQPIPEHLEERVIELAGKEHSLDSNEPAPVRWLLRQSQHEENESRFGPELRTHAAVERERARRLRPKAIPTATPPPAGAGAGQG